ncbi:limb region 1-like protein [Labeo rohita]|uniref:Limb region 1-like protein n=1 Tax=Labeo rohita TaxID=84645 RepID=A0A498M358_LABRO|nr:limb region 1-like protein [Labeo rohita]
MPKPPKVSIQRRAWLSLPRLWLCTFTLSVAVCAVLLLPISILSNEVLLTFPHSYYMQWLNGSLIRGLWNLVFLFSNLSLVFLMPFAYFFTESEGFAGSKKTCGNITCPIFILDFHSLEFCCFCCAHPLGFHLLENLEETMNCTVFEEASLSRKLKSNTCWISANTEAINNEFLSVKSKRIALELRKKASPWQRNLGYPVAMLLLLALTAVSVLMVCFHVLELLFDESAMPRGMEDPHLGLASFSMFGSLGAAVQVVIILYLMVSSVVGFYSSPLFTGLLPRAQDTTLTQIIGNCVSLLILSSALPVFSRTLGITRFDLLGDFGRYNWLGSFHIVFLYNMLFAGLTSACLINTVTWALQRELIRAFGLHKLPLTVSRSTIPLKLLLANGLSKIH